MNIEKNLGIWLDHSNAILIDLKEKNELRSLQSEFTNETKVEAINRSENLMHNKRQQMQRAFYEKIADEILKYEHVLLFGPTNAKTELHNFLNEDLHFKDIQIDIVSSDYITENEKVAFVEDHFKHHFNM